MDRKYTVFDASINRLLGVYETETQALEFVAALLSVNTHDYADDLMVDCSPPDGSGGPWTGDQLRARLCVMMEQDEQTSSPSSTVGVSESREPIAAQDTRR